jgi:dipeptidyl aminopeptidase/acylaminoacyl peptidase
LATTPTLVLHGMADQRVPVGQAMEFHGRLERAGVTTELVLYPDTGHAIGNPRRTHDLCLRAVHWLARFISGVRKPPVWPREGKKGKE